MFEGGSGRFVHTEDFFHPKTEKICTTFVHGDWEPVVREISEISFDDHDKEMRANWMFENRHDENSKRAHVLQIAFVAEPGTRVRGNVWM